MGNRAFVKFVDLKVGVYLHWNGGRDSVEAFLDYCRMKGYRADSYGPARFCQTVANYFPDGLSIGIESTAGQSPSYFDPGDNGVYFVKDWKITGRYPRNVQEQRKYEREWMLNEIDKAQPQTVQVGPDKIHEFVTAGRTDPKA